MKDLKGSEGNPIALTKSDFEEPVIKSAHKVYIYKAGWKPINEVTSISVDFRKEINIVSASLFLTVYDENGIYHPLGESSKADYFTYGRKIRVYLGLKKGTTPYTWPYFEGYIRSVQHRHSSEGRIISVRALDYCDVLSAHTFEDGFYSGTTKNITLQTGEVEYALPSGCNGVHRVTKDGEEYRNWTYNWETNILALSKEDTGTLVVYYYTQQNVIDVVKAILDKTLIGSTNLINDSSTKTIDRVYFNTGTTALQALEMLGQLVNFRFYFDGEGKPHFSKEYGVGTSAFEFKATKNVELGETAIEDQEYYNAVEVHGETRIRRRYEKKEVQIGSTISSSLDANTVNREHNFSFTNKERLRYELEATNKSGLTSELVETKTGCKIAVMHDPTRSYEEEVKSLGYVTGNLSHTVSGKDILNTTATHVKAHAPATRVKYSIPDGYNRFGLSVELNQLDHSNTEIKLDHDPLRHLATAETYLGYVSGSLSHTVSGKDIKGTEATKTLSHVLAARIRYVVPEDYNRFGLVVELNPIDYWTTEINLSHDPLRHLKTTETYLGAVTGNLSYALSGSDIVNTDVVRSLAHKLATRISTVVPDGYNRNGLSISLNPVDYWTTQVLLSHDPLRNLSTTVQQIGSASSTATTSGRLITVNFTAGKIFGNVRWEGQYTTGWGAEALTGQGAWTLYANDLEKEVLINLNQNYQGQIRWTGQAPANIPEGARQQVSYSSGAIPGNRTVTLYLSGSSEFFDLTGTCIVGNANLRVIGEWWQGNIYCVTFQNMSSSPIDCWMYIFGRARGVIFTIDYMASGQNWARFKLRQSRGYGGSVFRVSVYSKTRPYGTKIVQEEVTNRRAQFKATCDFGTPPVTIICRGQEPAVRPYKVELYGYEPTARPYRINIYGYKPATRPYRINLEGNRLIARPYFLKLFGRDVVSELTEEIYSHKSLSQAEINAVGGKRTLIINNHLIQSQADAELLATELLSSFSQYVSSYTITTTCPPPVEVGDTVTVEGEP